MLQPEPYRTSVLTIHLLPVSTTLDMTREKSLAPRILILYRILQMRKVKENASGVVTPVDSVDLQDTLPSAVAKRANFLKVTRIIILHLQILVILLPELPPLLPIHLLHTLHQYSQCRRNFITMKMDAYRRSRRRISNRIQFLHAYC